MAEEASVNLQKLGMSGGSEEQSDLNEVLDTFTHVEDNKDYVPPPSGAARRRSSMAQSSSIHMESATDFHSVSNSQTDSIRRKSFLNPALNLGLGLNMEAPAERSEVLEGLVEETEEYQEPAEQWEGGDEYYHQDQDHDQEDAYDQQSQAQSFHENENEK